MGLQGEDAERTENGVVAVMPEPGKGLTSKVIDWLEWLSVKLMHDSKQPLHYLSGNFAPVEETPLKDLSVIGHLPECLNGEFVRVGPNPKFSPIAGFHWFDGDGCVPLIHGSSLGMMPLNLIFSHSSPPNSSLNVSVSNFST